MQRQLRDTEIANDTFETQVRNNSSSLSDLESKYNASLERGVMLEEEKKTGEQEREALRIETQRLRDELSDLKVEAEVNQGKLTRMEAEVERYRSKKYLTPYVPPQSPISETSPATNPYSFPRDPNISDLEWIKTVKIPSERTSDTTTPSSPSISEPSTTASSSTTPHLPVFSATIDSDTTPRTSSRTVKPPRHSRGPSIPVSNGLSTPSAPHRTSLARQGDSQAQSLPHSSSLHQIRGLIGKMQKLEQRVHTARSKLPAPTFTPPSGSPRTASPRTTSPRTTTPPSGSPKGQSSIPTSVTMRSNRKRTGGSIATGTSSIREATETTPLSTHHISRLSFGGPPSSSDGHTDSHPSSRASAISHSSNTQFARPSSRASMTRTPLGHYSSQSSNAEGKRPRSSVGGSYAFMHGDGPYASGSTIEWKDLGISTPTPRRTTLDKNALIQGSAIPTPTGLAKRQSKGPGGFALPKTPNSKRTNPVMGLRDGERSMAPPERRRKFSNSDLGETY